MAIIAQPVPLLFEKNMETEEKTVFCARNTPTQESPRGTTTEEYVDELKQGESNILVAVRLRPLTTKERREYGDEIVKVLDRKVSSSLPPPLSFFCLFLQLIIVCFNVNSCLNKNSRLLSC